MSRNALIFQGGWDGHEPQATAEIVAEWLRSANFQVDVVATQTVLEDAEALRRYDLIVPNWTMGAMSSDATRNLCQAVAAGCGLGGWHGGMGDAFRDNTEYQFMVGGQFVGHPGGCIDYPVHIVAPHDPVMCGIADFQVHSEQYYMHVDPSNEVLATTVFSGAHCPWIAGTVMPVVWRRRYGQGKVFYCSLGHCAKEFENPALRTILQRGLVQAARA